MNLNELAKEAHQTSVEHGWWDPEPTFGELIALMHSELSEALEEYRADRGMVWHKVEEIKARYPGESDVKLVSHKPEGIAVELADCIIRMLDWIGAKWEKEWGEMDLEIIKCARGCEKSVLQRSFGDDINHLHDMLSAASRNSDNNAIVLSYFEWAISYIFDWAKQKDVDMESIIREKMDYNKTRPYRHGGKKL